MALFSSYGEMCVVRRKAPIFCHIPIFIEFKLCQKVKEMAPKGSSEALDQPYLMNNY